MIPSGSNSRASQPSVIAMLEAVGIGQRVNRSNGSVLCDHRGSVATQSTPRIASSIAKADPTGPPPTIRTSVVVPGDGKPCLLVATSRRY